MNDLKGCGNLPRYEVRFEVERPNTWRHPLSGALYNVEAVAARVERHKQETGHWPEVIYDEWGTRTPSGGMYYASQELLVVAYIFLLERR